MATAYQIYKSFRERGVEIEEKKTSQICFTKMERLWKRGRPLGDIWAQSYKTIRRLSTRS